MAPGAPQNEMTIRALSPYTVYSSLFSETGIARDITEEANIPWLESRVAKSVKVISLIFYLFNFTFFS